MMFEADESGEILRIQASVGRRVMAISVLFMLGGLLIWLAATNGGSMVETLVLIVIGFAALFFGEWLRRATRLAVILRVDGLFDSNGTLLAEWDDIKAVDRGAFAIKPSNGFSLVLNVAKGRGWAPGLWWRAGKRVGVGGVTAGPPARAMAEAIAFRLAAKDNPEFADLLK